VYRSFLSPLGLMLMVLALLYADTAVTIQNPQARAHYKRALEYGDKGLWSPVILELKKARELEPSNPAILLELGVAYGERKEWNAALSALRKAVALAPVSVRAHYNLALTLDRSDPGRGAGIPEYWKALKLDPQHVDSLMNLGVDIGDRNATEAKPLFERAIRLAPNNAKVHLNFGLLLNRQAEEEAAVAQFKEAIRHDPNLVEARRQLVSIFITQQDWTQAIEQCREILQREPEDAATRYNLARALSHTGDPEESKKELEQSQLLRKRAQERLEAKELQLSGIRDLRAGKTQQALNAFNSAVRLDDSAPNRMYLGISMARAGDVQAGVRELNAALQMEPRNALVHVNLGSVYLQNGQEQVARTEIERALELDPWLAEAHNNLGMILGKNEQLDEAVKHFRLAADIDPQYMEAIFNLGLTLRQMNRIDDALKAFRRATELAPENPQAQYALGMTLRDKGDAAGARVALDRAATLSRGNSDPPR
jgi:tetratricopeptide (TPR) repeat protein